MERILSGTFNEGRFIERVNRFVILCELEKKTVRAYLPNPGRLWELLLPERKVYLVRNEERCTTPYTAVAVERNNHPVLLHTGLANHVIERLIHEERIPGLEKCRLVKREVRHNRSRFDFLLEREGRPFYLEVKSCTLFGNTIAMFPDAVTARGRRHLDELGEIYTQGVSTGIVFLVHSPRVTYFLPDYHTDIDFAQSFLNLRGKISFLPISVEWKNNLSLSPIVRNLTIPWDVLVREAGDSGCYLLILQITEHLRVKVGSLGYLSFRPGFYIYVGSAKTNLKRRIERHIKRAKVNVWHIDYLTPYSKRVKVVPVRTKDDIECTLARAVRSLSDDAVPGFGSSDCTCPSHLFFWDNNPFQSPGFIEMLLSYRIDRLEGMISQRHHSGSS